MLTRRTWPWLTLVAALALALAGLAPPTARADEPPGAPAASPPAATILVGQFNAARFLLYDAASGQLIRELIPAGSGGLARPQYVTRGPDGDLYISSGGTASVKRYDAQSGAYLGDFVAPGSGGLDYPDQLAFRGGYLYVSDRFFSRVLRYDAVTGAPAGVFVVDGNLGGFITFAFGPDGDLYAGEFNGEATCIRRYDGQTGAPDGTLTCAQTDSAWGDLLFAPDGWLYATRYHDAEVWRIDPATGAVAATYSCPGSTRAIQLGFGPDGLIYTNNPDEGSIDRFDPVAGTCAGDFLGADPVGAGADIGPFLFLDATAFPSTPVLDSFSRHDGLPGWRWRGRVRDGYSIVGRQLAVGSGTLLWSKRFGRSQEAFVTIVEPGRDGSLQIVLKARGDSFAPLAERSLIVAGYEPTGGGVGRLRIAVYRQGEPQPLFIAAREGVILQPGMVLGARVGDDGVVRVYLNGVELLRGEAGTFFARSDGRIGLWAEGDAGAVVDDFGGGGR